MGTIECDNGMRVAQREREGCNFPHVNGVQAQLAEVSFYPQMLVLEKYPRDTPGKRADMHGSTWQPPLRLDVQGNPTF